MLKFMSKHYSQYHVLNKLCAAVPSNWRKPRPKYDITDAKFKFEFPKDLDTLKDKDHELVK